MIAGNTVVTIEALVFCLTSGTHWPLRTSAARSVSHEYGTVNKNMRWCIQTVNMMCHRRLVKSFLIKKTKKQMSIGSGADERDHLDTFLWAEQKLPVKVI